MLIYGPDHNTCNKLAPHVIFMILVGAQSELYERAHLPIVYLIVGILANGTHAPEIHMASVDILFLSVILHGEPINV